MFLRIGHRGARAHAPENTIKSFAKGIELGVNAIEFDVRQTKDGKIIVMHDDTVDRVTDGKGKVKDLTLEEIKTLVIAGEKVPTLGEALDFIDKKVDRIVIELKETGLEDRVLKEIAAWEVVERVVIVSFYQEALQKMREINQNIEIGLLFATSLNPVKAALNLKAQYLLPRYNFAYTGLIKKAHEQGLKVVVWTVNDEKEVAEFVKKGVDGIASDRPEILNIG